MKVVGLTGGIGSGKSTVARMFEDLGIPVYYADNRAKQLMHTSKDLKNGIEELFGEEAYEKGELNRRYIAGIVFTDKSKLEQLNNLVHPIVNKDFKSWTNAQKGPYVIQENPLIFEKRQTNRFDKVISVVAPYDTRVKRIMDRDHTTKNEVNDRMNNQLDDEVKIQGSDFVIHNIDLDETRLQVNKIHQQLLH